MMDIVLILGWVGMGLLSIDYLLLAVKKLNPHTYVYHILNFLGGILIIVSSITYKLWPVAVLNGFWSLIALIAIIKIMVKGK